MHRLLTAVATLAVALGTGGALAPMALAAPKAADADPQFCEAALSVYDTSLQYNGKGAFPEAAQISSSVRASAKYAPAKIAKDAQRVAKLYDDVAKAKNPREQALRWGRWTAKYNKSISSYFGYFADSCTSYLTQRVPGVGNGSDGRSGSGSSGSSSSTSSSDSED